MTSPTPQRSTDLTTRHSSVAQVAGWLTNVNPNLPGPQRLLAQDVAQLTGLLLTRLDDGPELTAGLRKLLEAKDCFVRQSLADERAATGELSN